MVQLHDVTVGAQPLAVLRPLIGDDRYTRLEDAAGATKRLLGDRIVWNVNSTASGGGVAEMLRVLVGYIRGAGIDGRWTVIDGDPSFFAITKRLHNRLHGMRGDAGALGPTEVAHYASVTAANAEALLTEARPGDVVLLHDPQTAGMAPSLADAGVTVIWRCHIGTDQVNSWTEEAWGLLRPYLSNCKGFVFSRQAYAPPWIPKERLSVIAPSIDPFSPKNQHISEAALPDFLARIGLTSTTSQAATFVAATGRRVR